MPVRDALATLPRALTSLRVQTHPNWELVAVDDGSTDGSAEWLVRAARDDSRVRVLRRGPEGIVAALNAGIEFASGEFIARFDADDECLPNRLASQWRFLEGHPEVGAAGTLVEFGGNEGAQAGYAAYVAWLNSVVEPEVIAWSRFIESPFAHPSLMVRTSVFREHGVYREGPFPEDYELWLRWLERGVCLAKVPEVLLRWHDLPMRLSRRDPRYSPDAFFQMKAPYLARWLRRHVAPERRCVLWGAGRKTRRRAEWLEAEGITISAYVDIDPNKQGSRRDGRVVMSPEAVVPLREAVFLIGYVGNRGARDLQRAFLVGNGWREGTDFLFAA
ncbi:MAG: glycosyltransferase family 2 protein [Verrucomicrobiales bacterium]|nr:glycosyltransferase family 2 protein [Verrucomicrobiales bacterium]